MIEINLTPLDIRKRNLGRYRFLELIHLLLHPCITIVSLCVVSLGLRSWLDMPNEALHSEIITLSAEISAQRAEYATAKREEKMAQLAREMRKLVPSVLRIVPISLSERITLREIDISEGSIMLSGVAHDTDELTDFAQAMSDRCIGLTVEVNRVSKMILGLQIVEQFVIAAHVGKMGHLGLRCAFDDGSFESS